MTLAAGAHLGAYEIVSPVGKGGIGEVYKARDTRTDRTVAIKVLPAELSENEERRQRFEREARAVSSLNHPNICTLYEFGHEDGVDFMAMEYLEGDTLAERLDKGSLTVEEALRHGRAVADALQKLTGMVSSTGISSLGTSSLLRTARSSWILGWRRDYVTLEGRASTYRR